MSCYESDLEAALADPASELDIHTAASLGELELIMNMNCDMDCRNRYLWTPLMYAAFYDHSDLVNFIINRISNIVGVKNDLGRTPLMLAAMCGNVDICKMLLRKFGQDILEEKDERGFTPLFHAVHCNQDTVAGVFLEAGANTNHTENQQGYSPLMVCCQRDNAITRKLAQMLLQYGADASYTNILGENAKTVAVKSGHDVFINILNKSMKLPPHAAVPASVLDGPAKLAEKLRIQEKERMFKKQTPKDLRSLLDFAEVDEKYVLLLQEKEVSLQQILDSSDQDLKCMGLEKMGPRRKLLSAIKTFRNVS